MYQSSNSGIDIAGIKFSIFELTQATEEVRDSRKERVGGIKCAAFTDNAIPHYHRDTVSNTNRTW